MLVLSGVCKFTKLGIAANSVRVPIAIMNLDDADRLPPKDLVVLVLIRLFIVTEKSVLLC